jgi:hypothetical protein
MLTHFSGREIADQARNDQHLGTPRHSGESRCLTLWKSGLRIKSAMTGTSALLVSPAKAGASLCGKPITQEINHKGEVKPEICCARRKKEKIAT